MRNSRLILTAMAAFGLMLACGVRALAEDMDNPQYQAWSKFGIGSSQSMEVTVPGRGGQPMNIQATTKLVDKAADHVTVEATVNFMGQAMPPHKRTIQAKTEKKDFKQIGTEDVTVGGKTISCKVYEGKGLAEPPAAGPPGTRTPAAQDPPAKFWVSEEVPGGIVKMIGQSAQGEVKMMLKEYEAK